MNLLPWLLDWPPSPAAVLAFLLVTAFSVGTLVLFAPVTDRIGPEEAGVDVSNVSVALNDELEIPDVGGDGVSNCVASGTPGDHLAVRADVGVETPLESDSGSYAVEVRVAGAATTEPVERTGSTRVDVFWLVRDDETLSVGETATVRVRLRAGDDVLATANRSVTVTEASRSYDCEN